MRVLFHSVICLCVCFLTFASPLFAAEITNLKTHFSSTQLTIEYDLLEINGDNNSGVEVLLEIKGKRYAAHMLSMSGDFGNAIAVGKKRRIIWRYPQDFPEGLDATFKCIVNAVPNSTIINEGVTPSEGFRTTYYAINKQTIVETRMGLMWTRNANIPVKPMKHADAQKLIQKLNQDRYAGYNDWRMPTQEDFEGLIFFGKKAGWGTEFAHFIVDYLTTCGFIRVQPGNYWTSTTTGSGQELFFVTNTWNGIARPLAGNNYYYLWPVRNIQ
jgi:hypothetical protein